MLCPIFLCYRVAMICYCLINTVKEKYTDLSDSIALQENFVDMCKF